MSQVNFTVIIKCSQDRVWEMLMDVDRYPMWLQGVTAAKLINNSKQKLGSQILFKGRGGRFRFDVIGYRPKDLIAWKLLPSVRGVFSLIQAFGTENLGNKTKVTVLEIYGGIFGFTMRWIMGRWFKRKLAQTLLNFRELAEENNSKSIQ